MICEKDEDHFFDRKALPITGAKLQKIAVAFANSDGGEFYVGVADEKQHPRPVDRWVGASSIEDHNQNIQALMGVTPTLLMHLEFLRVPNRGGYVLRVQIDRSHEVHVTADGTVYERKGAQSLPIKDPQRISELSFSKGAKSFEDFTIEDAIAEDVVESEEIVRFLQYYSPSTDPLELAVNKNFIDRTSFKPKVCGLLLFSNDPSSRIPKKCSVRITKYQTKEDDPDRDHLEFVESVEAPLFSLIKQSVKRVTEIMSSVKVWTSDGPVSMSYPPETIWEIVVNSLIHRDYSISDDVHIMIYNNRIEIISPGRLPAFVTVSNILDVRYARNPKLVGLLSKYPDAPNKDIGEGLNTAFRKMKERKLQPPTICEVDGYVRVTIPHASAATPQEAVLDFLDKNPQITNQQGREITGIKSENAMKSEFYKLRDAGLVEMIPGLKGNKAAWRRVEGSSPPPASASPQPEDDLFSRSKPDKNGRD
jgi:ATP-dependent DNA helicase RecG